MALASIISALPEISQLIRISKAIAMLDAILCEEWESRYYSFNSHWSSDDKTQMVASMRNGSGDNYFILFSSIGAAIKGFEHESPMSPANNMGLIWPGVLSNLPPKFSEFRNEAAFEMAFSTFCFWRALDDSAWHSGDVNYPVNAGADPDGAAALLRILDGKPSTYVEYAREYFGIALKEQYVSHIYELKPLTPEILIQLGSSRSLAELSRDIAEIAYPRD